MPNKFKKLLIKFMSNFIYSTGLRRAVRGNLVSLYYRTKRYYNKNIKNKENFNFPFTLSLVLIIKDEAQYVQEWLEYHLLVGVEKFYIYDNGSSDNLRELLEPYIVEGIVEYTYFPGIYMQRKAYNTALDKYKMETKWKQNGLVL